MNTVILKGNLARDPETRFLPAGTAITDTCIAVSEKWTTDSGEKKEKTAFIDLKIWGKRGEVVSQYFTKGSPILVRGKIEQESWEDRETGAKRSKLVVVVDEFDFCGDKKGEQRDPGSNETRQQQRPAQATTRAPVDRRQAQAPPKRQPDDDYGDTPLTPGMDDDEIPF